jgi:hypothetical protein
LVLQAIVAEDHACLWVRGHEDPHGIGPALPDDDRHAAPRSDQEWFIADLGGIARRGDLKR